MKREEEQMSTTPLCRITNGNHVCDQATGHLGLHRAYVPSRDDVVFWFAPGHTAPTEADRLRAALQRAGEAIHSEYCGRGRHHRECEAVTAALEAKP